MPSIHLFSIFLLITLIGHTFAVFNGLYVDDMEEFPYLVRVRGDNGAFNCTGSIISPNYVLTAAHCVRSKQFYTVAKNRAGEFIPVTDIASNIILAIQTNATDVRSSDMYEVNVSHVAVPPLYPFPTGYGFVSANPEAWEMDVAVLKLARPLVFTSRVNRVYLLTEKAYFKSVPECVKNESLLAGWGGNDKNRLKWGTWAVAPAAVCANESVTYYNYWQNVRNLTGTVWTPKMLEEVRVNMTQAIHDGLICGTPNPNSMEAGNSGGPAMVVGRRGKHYQTGVISNNFTYSSNCTMLPNCIPNDLGAKPMIYTRVSANCEWIEELTCKEVRCLHHFI